ncbi:hypothetical protein [Maritalea sp.]|uniref:hypothetical protein n=1 Tax=Maritalea sp. TaxID=2003361 RepID=UPI003EF545B2
MNLVNLNSKVIWMCFIAAMAIYVTMLTVTLPTLASIANGLPAFDMRPFGYSVEDANVYLQALSEAGRNYYIGRQLVLDVFYPPLLSLTTFGAASWCWTRIGNTSRISTIAFAVVSFSITLFDYAENIFIYFMLTAQSAPTGLIEIASLMTILKSNTTILAFLGLTGLFATQTAIWLLPQLRKLAASSK